MVTNLSAAGLQSGLNRGIQEKLNLALLELLEEIEVQTLSMGHRTSKPTSQFMSRFEKQSLGKQEFVLESLRESLASLHRASAENWRFGEIDRSRELQALSRFLRSRKAVLARPELMDRLAEDDVIEIYSTEETQIYRSWSCFRVCSYSLVDLLLYEWDILYERPTSVEARILECLGEALAPEMPLVSYNLPEYLIAERFEGHDNAFHFKMKNLSAILDSETRQPIGLISTGSAVLARGPKDSKKIKFL